MQVFENVEEPKKKKHGAKNNPAYSILFIFFCSECLDQLGRL